MSESSIKKLGPYLIDRVVGKGGMGSVFAARHEETGEKSAIKVLSPGLAADETFRDRFIAEIKSLETLNHPHIVSLHGYGEADGHLYYAMELVEGTNLEQELSAGRRFTWREVTQIALDVSRALKHAHDHGVIHRDLKPANLLMDADEVVKLSDFGIAKLFGSTKVTYNGSVLGTADYMAPEQAAGEPTTPRCDLYSLGCVMYALLSGKPPFQGRTIAEVVHKVRYEQHISVSRFADVPRDLQQVIDELLEKDPDDRIRTALSLRHRLGSIQQAMSISTTGEDEFSSDGTDLSQADRTQRFVNPPPDIAERQTVLLPEGGEPPSGPTEQNTIPVSTKRTPKKQRQLDRYTRVELEKARVGDSGRGSEFSSAVPLLLMLLTVLGGLMGGVWYSTLPMSADDLHSRIMVAAEDPERLSNASRDVNRFLENFPDDNRVESVQKLREEIVLQRLQRTLEVRARARKETGKLSPIEVHCNEAFRRHREGDIEGAIHTLEGIQLMFDDANQTDIGIQRMLQLISRLIPQWEDELSNEISGLRANIAVYRDRARELQETDPARARRIWLGIVELYSNRPWAVEYTEEAKRALQKYPVDSSDEAGSEVDLPETREDTSPDSQPTTDK